METRAERERSTEQPRHRAVAADSEYRSRHPGTDPPPLRSCSSWPAYAAEESTTAPGEDPVPGRPRMVWAEAPPSRQDPACSPGPQRPGAEHAGRARSHGTSHIRW
jgi:hypothetical protein